ncbi:hypothetical protein FOZ63_008968, partial [Perkinsus olseni]
RLLLIELIASSKRWRYQRESLLLVMRKVRDAKSPEDVVRVLSDAAYEAKYTSLEMFLNMKRSREGPESGSRSSKFRKEDTSNPLEGNDKEPSSSTADSQECWILPEGVASLPAGLDVNIGYSDLRNYGITIQLPTNEPDIVDLRLANSDVLRSAVEQKLAEQVGVYHSLPGGKKFLGTLRTLESAELRDTAQQRWTYEVHWDMDSISTGKNQSFDYSISMFDKLSTDQLEISDSELRKLTDPGWWWKENDPNPPVPAERALVLPDEIVSFPLLQSTFKSTKI